ARIGLGYRIDLVAVNHDDRRVGTTQVRIAKLDTTARHHGRRMFAHGIFEDLRQAAGGPAGDGRGKRRLNRLVQVADAGAVLGRNEMYIGKLHEEQPAFQLGLHVIALAGLHAGPLVQRNHQSAATVEYETQQVEVVFDHAFARVHHEDHHVSVLDRLQCLDHGKLFHRLEDLAATAYARGIDQRVFLVTAFEWNVNAVAGGAGLVIDDDPLFTEHAVDQRRLTDVGTADHGDLDAILDAGSGNPLGLFALGNLFGALALLLAFTLFGVVFRKAAQRLLQHEADATAVRRSYGQCIAQAQ